MKYLYWCFYIWYVKEEECAMATTSFTKNFRLQNRYSDNFVEGLASNVKPVLESNFKSKTVDNTEYMKVVSAFDRA